MNLLDAIPEIGKILDDLISTPEEKREAQAAAAAAAATAEENAE